MSANALDAPALSERLREADEYHVKALLCQTEGDSAERDGEFAGNSQTYAGTGTLRYTW